MAFPILFGIVAYGLTLASTFTCHLIDVKGADTMEMVRGLGPWTVQGRAPLLINGHNFETGLDLSNVTMKGVENAVIGGIEHFVTDHGGELSFGEGDVSASDKCYSWDQFNAHYRDLFDTEMYAARIFSMAAVVLGLILTIKLLFFACCGMRRFGFTAFLCYLEALFVGLTFLATDSFYCKDADTCTLGHSAILCGVATAVWFLVGVFLTCMPRTIRSDAVAAASASAANERDDMKV
jgi:hypothetical protein